MMKMKITGFIPSIRKDEDENNKKTRIDSQSARMCSPRNGGKLEEPPKCHPGYWVK